MQTAFARQTSLKNIVGRSEYITDPTRQEDIVLYSNEHMISDWQEYADYENKNKKSNVANNQGREIIVALPNELNQDHDKLKKVMDDYAERTLGTNREFEYAVHWNQDRTNLHAHIIYSERERVIERMAKKYKRDIYYNPNKKRISSKKDPEAEVLYKKGEVMKDNKGNTRYEDDLFTVKDKKFVERKFNYEIKDNLSDSLNKYGFNFKVFNQEIELPQAKLYKGASDDYIEKTKASNKVRQNYNQIVTECIEKEVITIPFAIEIKQDVLNKVREENKKTQSISLNGIEYIKRAIGELSNILMAKLEQIKEYFNQDKEIENMKKKVKELEAEVIEVRAEYKLLKDKEPAITAKKDRYHNAVNKRDNLKSEIETLKHKEYGVFEFNKQREQRDLLQELRQELAELNSKPLPPKLSKKEEIDLNNLKYYEEELEKKLSNHSVESTSLRMRTDLYKGFRKNDRRIEPSLIQQVINFKSNIDDEFKEKNELEKKNTKNNKRNITIKR